MLTINSYVWDVLDRLHQPRVRFEIELFLATLCIKFPELTLRQHLMPRLRDCNTNPQTATSCLVLTAWVFAVMQKQIGAGDNTNLEVRSISPLPFLSHSRAFQLYAQGVHSLLRRLCGRGVGMAILSRWPVPHHSAVGHTCIILQDANKCGEVKRSENVRQRPPVFTAGVCWSKPDTVIGLQTHPVTQ